CPAVPAVLLSRQSPIPAFPLALDKTVPTVFPAKAAHNAFQAFVNFSIGAFGFDFELGQKVFSFDPLFFGQPIGCRVKGALNTNQNIVPRVMLAPLVLDFASHFPQLSRQHQVTAFGFDYCGLGPQLVTVTIERFGVDSIGLNRPESPIAGLGFQIFIIVGGADKDAAARGIDPVAAVSGAGAVMGSAGEGFHLLNLAALHAG